MQTRVFISQFVRFLPGRFLFFAVALIASLGGGNRAEACGFHGEVNVTITQEIEVADAVVMAKLTKLPDPAAKDAQTDDGQKITFEIYHIIKGEKQYKVGEEVKAFYFGEAKERKVGAKFLLFAWIDKSASTPKNEWSTSVLSDKFEAYIRDVVQFPKDVGERMVKMQKYLAGTDIAVQLDAMSEFAQVETSDLIKVKDKLDIEQIRKALADSKNDPKPNQSLLALNYKLLGICGGESDIQFLLNRLGKDDGENARRLQSLIDAYLMLTKDAGLNHIEKNIFEPALEKDDFRRFYSVFMALREHGDKELFIKKEKITPILVKVLEYPKRADLVIMDLSKWKHWESADRIMKLYRETSDDDNPWIREPAVNYMNAYLKTDPNSEKVKGYLAEMERIDPAAFTRAKLFFPKPSKKLGAKTKETDDEKKAAPEEKPTVTEPVQSTSNK